MRNLVRSGAGGPSALVSGTNPARLREVLHEVVGFDRAGSLVGHPYEQTYRVIARHAEEAFAALNSLEEQLETLSAAICRARHELDQWVFADGTGAHRVGRAEDILAAALRETTTP